MSFSLKRQIYEALPLGFKKTLGGLPFPWLAGRAYRETFSRNDWMDRATRPQWLAWQSRALAAVLDFATRQVPAYQPLRPSVERFPPFDALKDFPPLGKEQLQQDIDRYLPRDFARIPHYECTTGGTSGNQLKFFLDNPSHAIETAFIHRQWARVGYTPKRKKATFRGVKFAGLPEGVYWQPNPIYHELQFSPFHMNDHTLDRYLEQLIRYQPDYLHGYPSAIDVLAEYLLRNGLVGQLPPLRAVLLGSEGCRPHQRSRIEQAFQTRVFSWYGHSERLVLGGECERDSAYHHFPDYGILEILAEDGRACDREGEEGEVVGTGLHNFSMPLIRYRTGDYATRRDAACACGRCWDRFDQVVGRWKQDLIVGRNGSRISTTALNMHGPVFDKIIRYQYYQDTVGCCELRVMTTPAFGETDRITIERAYRDKIGEELDIRVRPVADIPLTALGKLKLLDSRL